MTLVFGNWVVPFSEEGHTGGGEGLGWKSRVCFGHVKRGLPNRHPDGDAQ